MTFFVGGPLVFIPSYMARTLGMELAEIGVYYSAATLVDSLIGTVAGGLIGNRVARTAPRYLALVPALAIVVAIPVGLVAFSVADPLIFCVLLAMVIGVLMMALPLIFTAVQLVCGAARRAVATAILMAVANCIATALAPLMTGGLSDLFDGANSLRHALLVMMAVIAPAALIYFHASKHIVDDME